MEKRSISETGEGAWGRGSLSPNVVVRDLGRCEYRAAWDLQLRLAEQRSSGDIPDQLLLVEHPPVFTCGRRTKEENKPRSPVAGVPIYEIERGGDITYHGPGQLVGYPIVHLTERGLKIGDYIHLLEAALIDTLAAFGLFAHAREGREFTGVWVGERKIASIGLAVRHWVAFHGFALNVNTDLSFFEHIRPCGFDPGKMTSMERELGRPVQFETVKDTARRKLLSRLAKRPLEKASGPMTPGPGGG